MRNLPLLLLLLGSALTIGACTTKIIQAPPTTDPATPSEEEPEEEEALPADVAPYTQVEVQSLFDKRCLKCHDGNNALLDLSKPFTRETVGVATNTGQTRGFCETSDYVTRIVPGDRAASLLWHKVKGTHDCGSRMPYDKGNPKLTAVELERLGLFIDALAKPE